MSKVEPWGQPTQRIRTTSRRVLPSGRQPIAAALALLLALGIAAGGLAYYSSTFDGEIYRGVSVNGVDVSGRTPAEARAVLLERAAEYNRSPLTLSHADSQWQVTPEQLGLALDVDPLVSHAYGAGRNGSLLSRWWHRVPLVGGSTDIQARYLLDRGKMDVHVQGLAADIEREPVESALTLRPDGTMVASADKDGQRLDTTDAMQRIHRKVSQFGTGEIALPVVPVKPAQTREEWRSVRTLSSAVANEPVTLRLANREWTLSGAQVGTAIRARRGKGQVVGSFDARRLEKALAPIAAEVRRAPVDATLAIKDAKAVLTAEKLGQKLDTAATTKEIYAGLAANRRVTVATDPVPAQLTARDLKPTKERLDGLLSAPLALTHNGETWSAEQATVAGWLQVRVNREARRATVAIQADQVRQYVTALADDVRREPVNADLLVDDATPVLTPDRPGERLDVPATTQAAIAALSTTHKAQLVTAAVPVTITAADLAPAKKQLDTVLSSELTVTYLDETLTISRETLADWTSVDVDPTSRSATVAIDQAQVASYVSELGMEIYQEPRDGELSWKGGLVVTEPSVDGHILDTEKATKTLLTAPFATERSVSLPVTVTKPAVPTDDLAALGIKEVIGEGTSTFTGSPKERENNIHTAAGYLDNVVVPPGETFSFNEALGEISLERGYQEGLTIIADETVPGVGGGVCQVSTTTFRAAFWTGLPIDERNQHSYLVSYYQLDGSPEGFDAAVYQPYVDLKWTNNTDKHILIRTSFPKKDQLRVVLYGTDPGLDVKRGKPVIAERKPPLKTKIIRDPKLPRGTREQKEWAHEGMKVSLARTVSKDGKALFRDEFLSEYKPWGDVFLVGPPKLEKKPVVTPKPTEDPKPAEERDRTPSEDSGDDATGDEDAANDSDESPGTSRTSSDS